MGTCGTGTTTTTATCMAYSNGVQTAVTSVQFNSAAQQQCGNCVSTTAPCYQAACVTYQCVRGATSQCSVTCGTGITTTTATCMAYSDGLQTAVLSSQANPDALR